MVTRVWGKADSFELVFSSSGSSAFWEARVPADLEDGQYAVELYCQDESGTIGYWTGMLYLNHADSVKIRIVADKLKIWFEVENMKVQIEPELELQMAPDYLSAYLQNENDVWLEDEEIKLTCTVCGR